MNNASAGPWWFTAVVAGITAFATLLAGGLTTWLTLRYTNKRLAIEVQHQRSQERFKLLHTERLALYMRLNDLIEVIMDEVLATVHLIMDPLQPSMPERTESGLKKCYVRLTTEAVNLGKPRNQLTLLGSKEVIDNYLRFEDRLQEVIDDCLDMMSDDQFLEDDQRRLTHLLLLSGARLTESIRRDLGSIDA